MLETRKRKCLFCEGKIKPSYTDLDNLRKFLSPRAKIVPRQRSGVCSKHQRGLSGEIKRARLLGLLPFTAKV